MNPERFNHPFDRFHTLPALPLRVCQF